MCHPKCECGSGMDAILFHRGLDRQAVYRYNSGEDYRITH